MTIIMDLGPTPSVPSSKLELGTSTADQIIGLLSQAVDALACREMTGNELSAALNTALAVLHEAGQIISEPGTPVHLHRMWSCHQRHLTGVVYLLLGDLTRAQINLDVAIDDLRATPAAFAPDLNLAYARLHMGITLMGEAMSLVPGPDTQQKYLSYLHTAIREFDGASDNFGAIEPAHTYMKGTALVLAAEAAFFAGEFVLAQKFAAEAIELLDWFKGFENVTVMLEFCTEFLPQAIAELLAGREPEERDLIAQRTLAWDFRGSLPCHPPA